jgi:hypothetical protein
MDFATQLKALQTKVDDMFLLSTYLFTFVCEGEHRIAACEGTHVNRLKRNELLHGGNLLGDIFTIYLADKKGTDTDVVAATLPSGRS